MVERARNAGIAVVASAGLAVLAGCSGGQPAGGVAGEPVPTTESREWQRTERDYPFLEEAGDTVCNEWTRPGPHGLVEVSRERYSFESMNGALRGKLELAAGARAALVADGVLQVASCEDARAFIRRKREHTATSVLPAKREAVPDMPEEASPATRSRRR